MNCPDISRIKQEPAEEVMELSSYVPTMIPTQRLIEYFLDSNYTNRDEISRFNGKIKCLDDTDGKLKCYPELSSNVSKTRLDGDYKNYCQKCGKQFNNLLATQRHYVFTHPDPALLSAVSLPRNNNNNRVSKKRKEYDWLNEPLPNPAPNPGLKYASNMIVLKSEKDLKKVNTQRKLVQITKGPSARHKIFTLENIKRHPQDGIKVVKKSEIKFEQLKNRAAQNVIFNEKPPVRKLSFPRKTPGRQLTKIELNEDVPKMKELIQTQQLKRVKYSCKKCNVETYDATLFNAHMRQQHYSDTSTCPACNKTFENTISIEKHMQMCCKDILINQ